MLTRFIIFSGCSKTNNLIYFAWLCFRMTVIVVQDVDEFHTPLCGETRLLVVIPHLSFASRVWPFPGESSSRVSCLDLFHRRRRTLLPRFQFCKSCDDGASSGCRWHAELIRWRFQNPCDNWKSNMMSLINTCPSCEDNPNFNLNSYLII